MKYKLIGENNYFGNIQKEYFKNRGINDYYEFINIDNHKLINFNDISNMGSAIQFVKEYVDTPQCNIGIVVDEDVDGYTSASIIYGFLNENFNVQLTYIVHEKNKAHGIILDDFDEGTLEDLDLLIVPDAGSNDIFGQNTMLANDIGVLILDHHILSEVSENTMDSRVCLVNNQLENSKNPHLTGAGLALLFVQGLAKEFGLTVSEKYINLASLGLIGDTANSKDMDVQYIIQKGIEKIESKLIETIIEANMFNIKNYYNGDVSQQVMSWCICPAINSIVRLGDKKDRSLLFEAFAEIGEDKVFPHKLTRGQKKGEVIDEDIYQHIARLSTSFRGKQQRSTKKALEGNTRTKGLDSEINVKKEDKVIIVDVTDYIETPALIGLLANKISSKYDMPCIALRRHTEKSGKYYTGSARGDYIDDFMSNVKSSNVMQVAGHESAFGVQRCDVEIDYAKKALNELFKDIKIEKKVRIDFDIDYQEMEDEIITDLYSTKAYWGHGIEAPKIRIYDIEIDTNDIQFVGSKSNMLTFTTNYINYLMYNVSEEQRNELVTWDKTSKFNIIGKPNVNDDHLCRHKH